jgi:hypothetical protein
MIEVLKQMVEALEHELSIDWTNNEEFNASAEKMQDAIQAGKQAIKKLESQEPVAWMRQDGQRVTTASDRHNYPDYETRYLIPLYTHPPQRTWVGLTDEEMQDCLNRLPTQTIDVYARRIEAKLKEKNT